MTTYDIHVSITEDLANNAESQGKNREYAQEVAENYITGAFSHIPNDSCSIESGSEVYAPEEEVFTSFETVIPCTQVPDNNRTYDDLSDWWREYWENCDRDESQYDAVILITNYDGGGGLTYADKYVAVADGVKMLNVPKNDYSEFKTGEDYWGTWTLLHELGHALLKESTSWEHNSGDTFYNSSQYFRSPFASDKAEESGSHYNECNDYVAAWDANCVALKWNDCAYEAFY